MSVGQFEQVIKKLAEKITFNTENLYLHVITLRGLTANDKFIIQIFDNNAFDLTLSQVEKFIKDKWSFATSASASGNMYGYPVVGHIAGVNTVSEIGVAGGIYYANDNSRFEIIRLRDGAYASAVALTSFTITQQKTITLALNNVNKPSYRTVNTKLSLGGTEEGSANVNWTCYKYPLGDGKFKYEWVGRYKQSKSIAVTTGYGNLFMSPKISIALPDSNMAGKCIVYAGQEASTCWIAPSVGGSALDFYLLRATSNTISNNLEINITCSYVANG